MKGCVDNGWNVPKNHATLCEAGSGPYFLQIINTRKTRSTLLQVLAGKFGLFLQVLATFAGGSSPLSSPLVTLFLGEPSSGLFRGFPENLVTGSESILKTWWIFLKAINRSDRWASEVRSSRSWLVKLSRTSRGSFSQGSSNPRVPLRTQPPETASKTRLKASPGESGRPAEAKLFSTINSRPNGLRGFQCEADQDCNSRRIRKTITEDCKPAARAPNLQFKQESVGLGLSILWLLVLDLDGAFFCNFRVTRYYDVKYYKSLLKWSKSL